MLFIKKVVTDMALDELKTEFHSLIDEISNEKILEHFYTILNNLAKSEEVSKTLIKDIAPEISSEPVMH
jgi:hemerythrin-like domain-containing protein